MILNTLSVTTEGMLCPGPLLPLSMTTRGFLCFILVVDEEIQRGGDSQFKLWPREPKFGDYKYTKKDLERMAEYAAFLKQNTQDEKEMVTIMMLSMIYGLLD